MYVSRCHQKQTRLRYVMLPLTNLHCHRRFTIRWEFCVATQIQTIIKTESASFSCIHILVFLTSGIQIVSGRKNYLCTRYPWQPWLFLFLFRLFSGAQPNWSDPGVVLKVTYYNDYVVLVMHQAENVSWCTVSSWQSCISHRILYQACILELLLCCQLCNWCFTTWICQCHQYTVT